MKKLITLLFALISITLPVVTRAQNAAVGDEAPDFSLQTLGGGNFTLSEQKGKVVFIFFFGYACPHCISNGPNTQSGIYDVYKNDPDFVAVGIDTWDGNSSGVTGYRNSTGIGYPLCLMGSAVENSYKTTYDRIVIIDKDGIIRYKATSNATSSVVSDASDVIDTFLEKDPMKMMGDGDGDGDGNGTVTSIEEEDQSKLDVFPVPAKEEITLSGMLLSKSNFQIKIIDLLGKVNYEGSFTNRERLSLPVSQLKEGVYMVRLISEGESFTKRIMIVR